MRSQTSGREGEGEGGSDRRDSGEEGAWHCSYYCLSRAEQEVVRLRGVRDVRTIIRIQLHVHVHIAPTIVLYAYLHDTCTMRIQVRLGLAFLPPPADLTTLLRARWF